MKNVLICIGTQFIWLFERYGFCITDSSYDPTFGGQGAVEMVNPQVRIRFVSEREKVYLEFSPRKGWHQEECITVDLLCQHLTGKSIDSAMVTDESVRFLTDHFDDVLSLFSENSADELRIVFKKLKRERAKRLFG